MGYLDKLKAKADSNAAGELKMLPLEALEPSEKNFYRMCEIDALADSIAANGLEQNLVVKAETGGKYRIVTGHRRYQALLRLMSRGMRVQTVPCIVRPAETDAQEMLRMIASNQYRELTDYEKMVQVEQATAAVKTLRSTKVAELGGIRLDGPTREVVSRLTGMSGPAVSKYAGIAEKLIPELKARMEQGLLPFTVAYAACQYPAGWQKKMLDCGPAAMSLADVQSVAQEQEEERRDAEKVKRAEQSPAPTECPAEEAGRREEGIPPYSVEETGSGPMASIGPYSETKKAERADVDSAPADSAVESGRFGELRSALSGKSAALEDKAWDQIIVWNREKPPEDVYAVVHYRIKDSETEDLAYWHKSRGVWSMDKKGLCLLKAEVLGWFRVPKWEE